MKAKWVFDSVKMLNGDYGANFNWAHITCSIPAENDDGNEFLADISIRIPDAITSLEEIKAYVLEHGRRYLMIGAESDSYAPPLQEC